MKLEKKAGIRLLVEKYKKIFRRPENLNHYSKEDLRIAERKFLRWVLSGKTNNTNNQTSDILNR